MKQPWPAHRPRRAARAPPDPGRGVPGIGAAGRAARRRPTARPRPPPATPRAVSRRWPRRPRRPGDGTPPPDTGASPTLTPPRKRLRSQITLFRLSNRAPSRKNLFRERYLKILLSTSVPEWDTSPETEHQIQRGWSPED